MRAYVIEKGSETLDGLVQVELERPKPKPNQILVRMRAASLNYRDQAVVTGTYFTGPVKRDTVPLSDGAGEIVEVGEKITQFAVGDKVCGTFFDNYVQGEPVPNPPTALGAPHDGVLAEYRVFRERGLVHAPSHLSFEQAATLPCAGVTAWRTLMEHGELKPGKTVLCLGTGGVSIFALQFAKMAGARVIISSSSDAKLERARQMGADGTVNYRTHPEWHEEVLRLTGGRGADFIVEVGGAGTLPRSYQALAYDGHIVLIGFVAGPNGDTNPFQIMRKAGHIHGVFVGPKISFQRMNAAIDVNKTVPVVDKVFSFGQAREAYEYQLAGRHFGKIVIAI
jgi:NADPH:quinone reductase-like Zn-dependent oxidoreductase